jgi:hypothetical protein
MKSIGLKHKANVCFSPVKPQYSVEPYEYTLGLRFSWVEVISMLERPNEKNEREFISDLSFPSKQTVLMPIQPHE